MIAPSYTGTSMKRVSGGDTYYCEFVKGRGIRRFHTCRRVRLFVPEQRILHAGISLDDSTRNPRTVIQLPNGEQPALQDEWGMQQPRIRGLNGEQ